MHDGTVRRCAYRLNIFCRGWRAAPGTDEGRQRALGPRASAITGGLATGTGGAASADHGSRSGVRKGQAKVYLPRPMVLVMGARTQLVVASTVLCLAGDVELRRMIAIWCYRCRPVSGPKRREEAWLSREEQHDRGHEEQSKGSPGAEAVEKDSGKSEVQKNGGPRSRETVLWGCGSRMTGADACAWRRADRVLPASALATAHSLARWCWVAQRLSKAYNMNTARHGHPGMGRRNGPYKSKEDLAPSVMSWYRTEPASGHLGRTSGSANSIYI